MTFKRSPLVSLLSLLSQPSARVCMSRALSLSLITGLVLAASLVAGCREETEGGAQSDAGVLDQALAVDQGDQGHEDAGADACKTVTCELWQRCELVDTPCVPGGACEPVPVCVLDVERLCAEQACEAGTHCEPLDEPCGPITQCALFVHCVADEPPACTPDDCGVQPPTLPCADETPAQRCARDAAGECGWQQNECPHVGDPCEGCTPCPIPEFTECRWTDIGVCEQASDACA